MLRPNTNRAPRPGTFPTCRILTAPAALPWPPPSPGWPRLPGALLSPSPGRGQPWFSMELPLITERKRMNNELAEFADAAAVSGWFGTGRGGTGVEELSCDTRYSAGRAPELGWSAGRGSSPSHPSPPFPFPAHLSCLSPQGCHSPRGGSCEASAVELWHTRRREIFPCSLGRVLRVMHGGICRRGVFVASPSRFKRDL